MINSLYNRLKIPLLFVLFYLACSSLLRPVLLFLFTPEFPGLKQFSASFFYGFLADLSAASLLFLPFFLFFSFFRESLLFKKKWRSLLNFFIFAWPPAQIFLFITEYFFFEEFNSRFNAVAVDYLIYPSEVFINIWQSYNVVFLFLFCVLLGLPVSFLLRKALKKTREREEKAARRTKLAAAGLSLCAPLLFLAISPFKGRDFPGDRIINEIGKNGFNSFVYAAYSHNLDFRHFYRTIGNAEAAERARRLVVEKGAEFTGNSAVPVERKITALNPERKLNAVIFVVESFGSDFWGVLGRQDSLTPEMDRLSKEGLLFTNLYSTGNRTVRGLEGILAGFPPLPAESIIKLRFSDSTRTAAQIFREKGYETLFIYGGRGVFDNMKPFALRYGFDRFIEQKDYERPRFKTIWGVSDQDIYDKALSEFVAMDKNKKPFFTAIMSVSNHKPYTYPEGVIPEDPGEKRRANAVKYTDFALGEFFEKAKKESFYKNTVFIVVADHGARVYGKQEIPVRSYEIPMLILGPGIKPDRNGQLGSSIDVAPTLFHLLGFSYVSRFFGRSLLNKGIKYRWLPVNHNRSAGFYDGKSMAVLGLNKAVYHYSVEGKSELEASGAPDAERLEAEKNAVAVFQTAWDIYRGGLK